jgi:hypothetical protein
MTLGAMAAALMALAYSYMTSSTRAAAIALIVAAVPLVPVVLPALM